MPGQALFIFSGLGVPLLAASSWDQGGAGGDVGGFDGVGGGEGRLDICQKIYTTGFSDRKFYTLKVCNMRLFLLKKKLLKCSNLVAFLLEIN